MGRRWAGDGQAMGRQWAGNGQAMGTAMGRQWRWQGISVYYIIHHLCHWRIAFVSDHLDIAHGMYYVLN